MFRGSVNLYIYKQKSSQMGSGIYKILNNINGKFYIGSAVNIERRLFWHKSRLRNNSHPNIYLQRAWLKYGEENFTFHIIEIVDRFNNEDSISYKKRLVMDREQFYLDFYLDAQSYISRLNNNFIVLGYNLCPVAGNTMGRHCSEETRKKISNSLIGKMVGDKNPNYGRKHTVDTKKRISDFRKNFGKKILCVTNETIYDSIKIASIELGIKPHNIIHVLKGRWKQTKGFIFIYHSDKD